MATGHDGWNFRRYIVWCSGLRVGIIPVLLSWTEWKTEVYITVVENKGLVRKWGFEFHRCGVWLSGYKKAMDERGDGLFIEQCISSSLDKDENNVLVSLR